MGKKKKQSGKAAPAAVKAAPDYKKYIGLGLIPLAFFAVEAFGLAFLGGSTGTKWPLVFGLLWAVMLSGAVLGIPAKAGRIVFGLVYGLCAIYAVVETGYYILFKEMMWLSDFRYASEGSDYFSVLLSYPICWWLGILVLIGLGVAAVWLFPRGKYNWKQTVAAIVLVALAGNYAYRLPYEDRKSVV